MYSEHVPNGWVIISLCVDGLFIFGTNMDIVNDTKNFLSKQFEMKDMGKADVI